MSFKFLQEIQESRLISNKRSFSNFSLTEITEITFLYFLTLQILRNELEYKARIDNYAAATIRHGNFETYQRSGNDLYQLLFIVSNDDEHDKLSGHSNSKLSNRINLRTQTLLTWLRYIDRPLDTNKDHRFLLYLENALNIKNPAYKAIRRLVEEWDTLNTTQKELSITRLLQAMRSKAKKSELLPWLEQFARKRKLELIDAHNPEEETPSRINSYKSGNVWHKAAVYTGAAVAVVVAGIAFNRWRKK